MLKEIHIIQSLIDLIINYIEKKTQKGICTFELFKEVLSVLSIDLDEKENKKIFTEGLFIFFSMAFKYQGKGFSHFAEQYFKKCSLFNRISG